MREAVQGTPTLILRFLYHIISHTVTAVERNPVFCTLAILNSVTIHISSNRYISEVPKTGPTKKAISCTATLNLSYLAFDGLL